MTRGTLQEPKESKLIQTCQPVTKVGTTNTAEQITHQLALITAVPVQFSAARIRSIVKYWVDRSRVKLSQSRFETDSIPHALIGHRVYERRTKLV